MSPQPIVTASNLTKSYGPDAGVFDMDVDVSEQDIVALIGPSGSGKTTTVRLMTGLLSPDAGSIKVLKQDPTRFTRKTRGRIGYMSQDSVFYPDLTIRENLNFAASLYGMPYQRKSRLEEMIEFVDLGGAADRLLRQASGGEKRRLSLAATLVHGPDLTFLDEPTAGVDPVLRRKFWDHFEHLSSEGSTMLITTQYVGEAAYCDYVGVLARGRMLIFDTPKGLRRRAFGGEMLDVVFTTPPRHEDVTRLADTSMVKRLTWLHDHAIRLAVEDAGSLAPTIIDWARGRNVEIDKTEPYLPPFDDVFVELVATLDGHEEESRDESS